MEVENNENGKKIRMKLQFTSNSFAPICAHTHTHTRIHAYILTLPHTYQAEFQIKFIHTHNETTLAGPKETCGQKG